MQMTFTSDHTHEAAAAGGLDALHTIKRTIMGKELSARKTTTGVCIFLLLLMILPSCQRDREVKPTLCRLTQLKGDQNNVIESYQYNEKGQLVEVVGDMVTRLYYNSAGQLIRIARSNPTIPSAQGELTLAYSNNGRSVLIKYSPPLHPALAEEYTAELDEKGQLLSYSTYQIQMDKTYADLYAYDQAGNLLKATHRMEDLPGQMVEWVSYEQENFDDAYSPYFTSESLRMYKQLSNGTPVSRHNALTVRHYRINGSVEKVEEVDYAYSPQGYPSKRTNHLPWGVPISAFYTYHCP